MTTQPHDNAFTGVTKDGYTNGLSKREYFAAMAMQSFLSNSYQAKDLDETRNLAWQTQMEISVEAAVIIADALIEQLNK